MATAPTGGKAPKIAARKLREAIFAVEEGGYLGSESDLMARFSLSRSTLRQAARILEQEQLLVVKRGIRGGYFAQRPDASAVVRAAALYLRLQRTTMLDVVHTSHIITMEIARLAAECRDETLRGQLAAMIRGLSALKEIDAQTLLDFDLGMNDLLAKMAANPPLVLFHQTIFRFGLVQKQIAIFGDHPDRCFPWFQLRLNLVRAILGSDPEIAALLSKRMNTLMSGWVEADLGKLAHAEDHGLAPTEG